MAGVWREAVLTGVREIAPQVRVFTMKTTDGDVLPFQAGQFITMDLPVHEKRLFRWRSYSLASAPENTGSFELCIVRNPLGLGTAYLFDQLQLGQTLRFKGPEGRFILPESLPETLCLVCTGTGVAPFRSMLKDLLRNPTQAPAIRLLFGTRKAESILFLEDWIAMANQFPDFQLHVALSRETNLPTKGNEKIAFHHGYVHGIYLSEPSCRLPGTLFYLCGWQAMIDEAREKLALLGIPPAMVRVELYG